VLYTLGGGTIYNDPGATLQAGAYTLTVAVGNLVGVTGDDFTIYLGTTTQGLASYTGLASELQSGALADKTVVLNVASGNSNIGAPLRITLEAATASNTYAVFDNVRLSFVPVPEPGALTMLGAALLSLLCYAWRKRK
jgi:hypothetical protein